MYLKIADHFKFKSGSLVKRLMLLYSISVIGIILSLSLFLYPTFMDVINHLTESYVAELCYKKVILGLLLSAAATIVLGYIIARNGLIRLREFSEKMETITSESLDQRINPKEWPNEIKNVADKFNLMLDRIHNSFNQLSQYSSDIAHELRNPINNLLGMTEITLAKDKSIDEYKRTLEFNHEELVYVSRLIDNLFFLAHADHGQIKIDKKNLDAKELILRTFEFYQATADENEITLICEGKGNIFADPTLFKRVINNLLSNALKYSPKSKKITVIIHSYENHTMISIVDQGIGIASEHHKKVFDRFYRVDPSRSALSGGLGLGLSIVKSIIELHKGRINMESTPNIGTAIHFTLPNM